MTGTKNTKARLVVRAQNAADYAAREAVTKIMTPYTADRGLPAHGVTWTVTTHSDHTGLLSGHIDSGTPDCEVRAIVDAYVAAWGTKEVHVQTRPSGDKSLSYLEATGLEVDGSPVEVWGVLGYDTGESGD